MRGEKRKGKRKRRERKRKKNSAINREEKMETEKSVLNLSSSFSKRPWDSDFDWPYTKPFIIERKRKGIYEIQIYYVYLNRSSHIWSGFRGISISGGLIK